MAGIKLILQEIRDLRVDLKESLRKGDEDRRRADDGFEALMDEMREERRQGRREFKATARAMAKIGGRITGKPDEHTTLLKDIRRDVRPRGNGLPPK